MPGIARHGALVSEMAAQLGRSVGELFRIIVKSCSGQVILAFSSSARVARIVELVEQSSDGHIDRAALSDKLAKVRKLGYDRAESSCGSDIGETGLSPGISGEITALLRQSQQ